MKFYITIKHKKLNIRINQIKETVFQLKANLSDFQFGPYIFFKK